MPASGRSPPWMQTSVAFACAASLTFPIISSKIKTSEWIEVVTQAHAAGIPTTATVMYGHVETLEERIEHILIIREIQKETGGITEFVPLPFMPYNNPVGEKLMREGRYATPGLEDLKNYAVSRILLHGYPQDR